MTFLLNTKLLNFHRPQNHASGSSHDVEFLVQSPRAGEVELLRTTRMAETEDFLRVHDKRYIEARERGRLLETQEGWGLM